MKQEFSVSRNSVITNFSEKYYTTSDELLSSTGFKKILSLYLAEISTKDIDI